MTITANAHIQHLINAEWDSCEHCSYRLHEQKLSHYEAPHSTARVGCMLCRDHTPEEWAEAFLNDLEADAEQVITLGQDPATVLAELDEMAKAVQTGLMKGRQKAPLGEKEKIMNESTAAQLERQAEEILSMTDEQMAAQVDAQVAEAEKADAADVDFHSTFKNLFEKVNTGQSLALPAGQYPARIVGCSFRLASSNGQPQLVVTAQVAKGEFAGTLMTKYLTLGITDKAQRFFVGQLEILGIDDSTDPDGWRDVARIIQDLNTPVWAEVGPQTLWQGKAQTNVKWFNAVSAPAARSGSVVSQSDLASDGGE